MSKIKSSLELALERTADVAVDRDAVRRDESTKKGRALAGRFLREPKSFSLSGELAGMEKKESEWAREGLIESLLANICLPRYKTDLETLPVIGEALGELIKRRGSEVKTLNHLITQYRELFSRYLDDLEGLEERIRAQWEPRLRQKEQQLRAQTGQNLRLTPEQDPEYAKVLGDQLGVLESQYTEVITQGKGEIRKLLRVK